MDDRIGPSVNEVGPTKGRATMAEVAQMAGVGLSTVSRVIRGAPSVSSKTREKVEEAVKKSGYQVDPVARMLRSNGNLNLIAFVTPDIKDPYFAEVYYHLQKMALERRDVLLVGSHAEDVRVQRELLDYLSEYRPTAIALVPAPGTSPEEISRLQSIGISVVVVDRPVEGASVDAVLSENEKGASLLVDRLVEDDTQRVGIVMLPASIWTQSQRLNAVRTSLSQRGLEPVVCIEEPSLEASSSTSYAQLIEAEVDTVIALSVLPAMGAILYEMQSGAEPAQIGCFDRHPLLEAVRPTAVTVSQDPREVAMQIDFHISRRRANPDAAFVTSILEFNLDSGTVQT